MTRSSTDSLTLPISNQYIPVSQVRLGPVEFLPPQEEGVTLIVSRLVLEHPETVDRTDLVCVDRAIRDKHGTILGCRGLSRRNRL